MLFCTLWALPRVQLYSQDRHWMQWDYATTREVPTALSKRSSFNWYLLRIFVDSVSLKQLSISYSQLTLYQHKSSLYTNSLTMNFNGTASNHSFPFNRPASLYLTTYDQSNCVLFILIYTHDFFFRKFSHMSVKCTFSYFVYINVILFILIVFNSNGILT